VGLDDALADDVFQIEVCRLAIWPLGSACIKRLRRLVVLLVGGHRDDLALRVAQRREPPSEHTARVDTDRAVEPYGLGNRGVAIDDDRVAPVVLGPWVADGQPVLVGLAGRVTVKRKGPHGAGCPPVHVRRQAGMGDHKSTVIEHVVPDEAVDELGDLSWEIWRLSRQLLEGDSQTVGGADSAAPKGT
jgi:hypothetical protein